MSGPLPIFQILRQLQAAEATAQSLRFIISTAAGLRSLTVEEALKLIPETPLPVVESPPPAAEPFDPTVFDQIADQLIHHHALLEQLVEDMAGLIEASEHEPAAPAEAVVEAVAVVIPARPLTTNVILGDGAAFNTTASLTDVTVIGHDSMVGYTRPVTNSTAVGAHARVTGDHQVVLGDARSNLVVASGAHRRADTRDFKEVAPCSVGLDFVLNVQPIQYKEDFRDLYIDWARKPVEPAVPRSEPSLPMLSKTEVGYQPQLIAYRCDKAAWDREMRTYRQALADYAVELPMWIEVNCLAHITGDGTHLGQRTHTGFSGKNLMDTCASFKLDLGLVQDHCVNDGEALRTVSDAELVPILWCAVQDLYKELHSSSTVDRVASELTRRHLSVSQQTSTAPQSDSSAED